MSELNGTWTNDALPGEYHGLLPDNPDGVFPWMQLARVIPVKKPQGSIPLADHGDETRIGADLYSSDDAVGDESELNQTLKAFKCEVVKNVVKVTDYDNDQAGYDLTAERQKFGLATHMRRLGAIWVATFDTTGIHGVDASAPSTKWDAAGSTPKSDIISLVKSIAAKHDLGSTRLFGVCNEQVALTLRSHSNFNSIGGLQRYDGLAPLDVVAGHCGLEGIVTFPGIKTTSNRNATTVRAALLSDSFIVVRVGQGKTGFSLANLLYRQPRMRNVSDPRTPECRKYEWMSAYAPFAFTESSASNSTIATSGRIPTCLT